MTVSGSVEPVGSVVLESVANQLVSVSPAPLGGAGPDVLQMVPVEAGRKPGGSGADELGLKAILSDLSASWEKGSPKAVLEQLGQLPTDLAPSPSGDLLQDMRNLMMKMQGHTTALIEWQYDRSMSSMTFHTAINLAQNSSQNVKTLFQDK